MENDVGKKPKNRIVSAFIVALVLICSLAFLLHLNSKKTEEPIIEQPIQENESNPKQSIKDEYKDLIELYASSKELNSDYIGQLYFDSNLINLPVVQGDTNNTYLRTDWQTMKYEIGGTPFLDAANIIEEDQNLIIYGHNYEKSYDPSLTKMFTPLGKLKEEVNYKDNNIINLFLGDKVFKYQIVATYRVKVGEENGVQFIAGGEPIYVIRNYTQEEFEDYRTKYKERQYYDTGLDIEYNDKLLTLQTCIDGSIDKFIVLAKQIEVINIEE